MKQHPSDHLLVEYSAGSLSAGPALCIATHLEQCHECSRRVEDLNLLGAAMFDQSDSEDCSDDLFDRILNNLDDSAPHKSVAEKRSALAAALPDGLSPAKLASIPWKPLAGGVSEFDLAANDEGFVVKLLRVKKGRSVFQHTHTDSELTVLLQGGYSDELGSYTAGDFIECDGSHTHKPVAHRDQDCILLTAVSGKLRFTGPLSRFLNPFIEF